MSPFVAVIITLHWSMPTMWSDASTMKPTDILGMQIDYGLCGAGYDHTIIAAAPRTTAELFLDKAGQWCARMRTLPRYGQPSVWRYLDKPYVVDPKGTGV